MVSLAACGNNVKRIDKALQGTWELTILPDKKDISTMTIEFDHGRVITDKPVFIVNLGGEGTYTIEEDKIVLSIDGQDKEEAYPYTYENGILRLWNVTGEYEMKRK